MAILIAGVLSIVAAMFTAMGVPFVYYLKRDRVWNKSDRSIATWYAIS